MQEHIKINCLSDTQLITIKSDFSVEGLYFFLKEFYPLLLEKLFTNQNIEVVTLNPEKDAVCYELNDYKEMKIGKDKLIINSIEKPTPNVLMQIACSMEFELGTLSVICTDNYSQEQRAQTVYKYFNTDIEESEELIPHKFCYCEPDGYILYLVNTDITIEEINGIIRKAESII